MAKDIGHWHKTKTVVAKICWWVIQWTAKDIPTQSKGFPDLCPTDNAEHVEQYIDRLNELLINREGKVREIAITAPYSGGKSSLINTFCRRHSFFKYTRISLAAFKDIDAADINAGVTAPDNQAQGAATTQINTVANANEQNLHKIEKSIIQQILYQTDSDKAPNSRFRRIFPVPPSYWHTLMVSTAMVFWLAILVFVSSTPKLTFISILSDVIQHPIYSNYKLWLLIYCISLPILVLRDGYRNIHKYSITKFNPLKGDVAFDQQRKDSIFNIYLEEIIYYFATTKSDVVFFEDLDRFERTDIFIKLKELNKLINDSNDVKQSVRFIYALRDDVFEGKNRTKFFDAIIPIIPIANSSNSYPQLKKLIADADFELDLKDQFLRDISVYMDDMRMLKNIVSEYGIYKSTLQPKLPELDCQTLFGFIVYKNAYCDDFAKLHDGQGMLFDLFKSAAGLKQELVKQLDADIESQKQKLVKADAEQLRSLKELNTVYVFYAMARIETSVISHIDSIDIRDATNPETFDKLNESTETLTYRHPNQGGNYGSNYRFNQWLNELTPPYDVRKEQILNKNQNRQKELKSDIQRYQEEKQSVKTLSLRELCNKCSKNRVFKGIDKALLIHLLEKGYIDEYYHLYITHFHEGQMTANDMTFVMAVKSRQSINRAWTLDNCGETYKYFSDEEFKRFEFMNYKMIDHLLAKNETYPIRSLLTYGVKNTQSSLLLIKEAFHAIEDHVGWLQLLCEVWPTIWLDIVSSTIIASTDKNELLAMMFIALEQDNNFEQLADCQNDLAAYLDGNEAIADYFPSIEEYRIKLFGAMEYLGVSFQQLEHCAEQNKFLDYVVKYQLCNITTGNLLILLNWLESKGESVAMDYSVFLQVENEDFRALVNNKVNGFTELVGQGNIGIIEVSDVINLLNNKAVTDDCKQKLIANVDFQVLDIEQVKNTPLWAALLTHDKVYANWVNAIKAYWFDTIEPEPFLVFLNRQRVVTALCSEQRVIETKDSAAFLQSILRDEVDLNVFKAYYTYFDQPYALADYVDIPVAKLEYLIWTGNIEADLEHYQAIKQAYALGAYYLLEENFGTYFDAEGGIEALHVEVEDYNKLLISNKLSNVQKHTFVEAMGPLIDEKNEVNNKGLLSMLLLIRKPEDFKREATIPKVSAKILRSLLQVIVNKDDKIILLVGQLQHLETATIESLLSQLGGDYAEISKSTTAVTIARSSVNNLLALALQRHDFIVSSKAETGLDGFRSKIVLRKV